MQGEKKQFLYTMFGFACAAGVFYMSILFQKMAYWSEGMIWYWVGVALTYAIGIAGTVLILQSLKIEDSGRNKWFVTFSFHFVRLPF